ncbi:MAG: histone deacetylase [Verrucomicrobiota bacterium]
MIIITHPACTEYREPGHPERPERIIDSVKYLKQVGSSNLNLSWQEPGEVDESLITRVHSYGHLARMSTGREFDPDTPAYPDIDVHAKRAVAAAITGLGKVLDGQQVFVLMRPPGHHATAGQAMGFCYLNQVAIATLEAQSRGVKRVAVLDFDVHHGNGTEAILRGKPDILFVSIHQHPCYPGTGLESFDNCQNYPVAPRTPALGHMKMIQTAINQIEEWNPDLLIVSAGFDAYQGDMIADMLLEPEDFKQIGQMVKSLAVPHLDVLEGGYSNQLPELIHQYLRGVAA